MSDPNFIGVFRDEALELLSSMEHCLLELELHPENRELISALFRIVHTIKGSSAIVGLENISHFTHELETIMDSIRAGHLSVTKGFIDYTLKARDIIHHMIDDQSYSYEDSDNFFKDVKRSLHAEEYDTKSSEKNKTFRIVFTPEKSIFKSGINPQMLIDEVVALGEAIVIPDYSHIPPLLDIDAEELYLTWEIYLITQSSVDNIRDIFIFVEGSSDIYIEELNDDEYEKLGEVLLKRGSVNNRELEQALSNQKKLGEILVEQHVLTVNEVNNALKAQDFINKNRDRNLDNSTSDSIRIKANKLDKLVDLVGEIVTIHAQMKQYNHNSGDSRQNATIERFGYLTEELRDNAMSLRMLPIGSTFSRFKRVVRDLSSDLGKKINLITEGAETELDKNVIEQLYDPLVHIIRNSIDHGIEDPIQRVQRGKGETGTIRLSAIHSGASVHIIIEDDGGGLDREKIREKAINHGLLKEGELIDDDKLLQLIFAPGFSTAENVTKVSGRGVGMDAVKRQIEGLKGIINVESIEGEYSRITLELPITLAIIEGLQVRISNDSFIIPLSRVEACIELKSEDKNETNGRRLINFRGTLTPYIDVRKQFFIEGDRKDIEQIVIVNADQQQFGILVDSVVGSNQTVIKPLGVLYRHIEELSGASILGDGSVALVIDIDKLHCSSVTSSEMIESSRQLVVETY